MSILNRIMSARPCATCLRARILDAARQPFGDAQALFDRPQNQHARVRRHLPAVEARHYRLAANR
jgi:hypothetical protein